MTPSVAKNIAWRSRGMTWVEIGSGVRPSSLATCSSTAGSMLAKVPTAPEMAQVAISSRAAIEARAVAVELGIGLGELEAEGHRLGMDAVAAADGRGELVLEGAALEHREQRVEVLEQHVGRLLRAAPPGWCRARRSWSCPGAASAAPAPSLLARPGRGRRSRHAWSPPRSRRSPATSISPSTSAS